MTPTPPSPERRAEKIIKGLGMAIHNSRVEFVAAQIREAKADGYQQGLNHVGYGETYVNGFRAGQERMRERAAKLIQGWIPSGSLGGMESIESRTHTYAQKQTAEGILGQIRSLPLEDR